jgi:hypothetical protein
VAGIDGVSLITRRRFNTARKSPAIWFDAFDSSMLLAGTLPITLRLIWIHLAHALQ